MARPLRIERAGRWVHGNGRRQNFGSGISTANGRQRTIIKLRIWRTWVVFRVLDDLSGKMVLAQTVLPRNLQASPLAVH